MESCIHKQFHSLNGVDFRSVILRKMSFLTGTHSIRRRGASCRFKLACCAWRSASCGKTTQPTLHERQHCSTSTRLPYCHNRSYPRLTQRHCLTVHLWLLLDEGVTGSKPRSFSLNRATLNLVKLWFSACVLVHISLKWSEAVTRVAQEDTTWLSDIKCYAIT